MIGRPTYTGNKSMEVQVLVDVEYMDLSNGSSNRIYRERACDAFFTMVSLSADDWAPQSIPSLKLLTDAEKKRFEEGRLRQETRKTQRLQAKTNQ
uniref:Cytosolic acyl coenzyme A thioester hydrolase-like n=1 Tax=Saccoglossus kowalevskii TaxID=10224 RepID=A0ABM0LW69_SACKO|nr:PREDICTED: cytosolic acyl coenzyme A thioester hydrolase-like [Saccoglossus kowalevskii]